MKVLLLLCLSFPTAFAFEPKDYVLEREIPLVRLPLCRTWIPEGNIWGCARFERRDMADRNTIKALVDEIRDLKARLEILENQM